MHSLRVGPWVYIHASGIVSLHSCEWDCGYTFTPSGTMDIHSREWDHGSAFIPVRLWMYIHSEWDCSSTFTPRGTMGLHSLRVGPWVYIHSQWDRGSIFIPSGTVGLHSLRRIPRRFVFYEAQSLCLHVSSIYDAPYESNYNCRCCCET